jgi:c-di-GMP-binding flagellar brake protein YcgR
MRQTSGLTIRQHEREGIQVPIEFVVSEHHTAQVRFSPSSSAAQSNTVRGRAVDISPGGMGLELRQFLPRMCEGTIRIYAPDPMAVAGDGTPILDLVFEHAVKVRRVYLIARDPVYAMGVAFVEPSPDIDKQIATLLKRMSSSDPYVLPPTDRRNSDA